MPKKSPLPLLHRITVFLSLICSIHISHSQQIQFSYQQGLSGPVKKIIPIPGSTICLIADKTGGIIAWNRITNKILCRVQSISGELNDMVYCGSAQMIVVAGSQGLDILDATQLLTAEKLVSFPLPEKAAEQLTALCWNEENKLLYTLRSNGEVKAYESVDNLKNGKPVFSFLSGIRGSFAIQCIKDNICILGINRQAFFNNRGTPLFSINSYATLMYGYTFDEKDSAIYVPRDGNIIKLSYRQNRFAEKLIPLISPGKEKLVTALLINEKGELLAGTNDDRLYRLSPGSFKILNTYQQTLSSFTALYQFNDQLLVGNYYGNITILHPENLKAQYQLNEDATPSLNGVYLFKNRYMITTHFGVRGSSVKIWDIPAASLLQSFLLNANLAYDIRFSKNGDTIYSLHTDEAIFRYFQKGNRFHADTIQKPFARFLPGSIIMDFTKDKKAIRQEEEDAFAGMLKSPGVTCYPADPEGNMTLCFADSLFPPAGCKLQKLPLDYRINAAFLVAAGLGKLTAGWDMLDKDMYSLRACSSDSLAMFLDRTKSSGIDSVKASRYYRMMKGLEACPRFIYMSETESTRFLDAIYYQQRPLYVDLENMPQTALFFFPDTITVWKKETNSFESYYSGISDMDLYYDYNKDYIAIADPRSSSIRIINRNQPGLSATRWMAFGEDDYLVHTSSGYFKTKGRSNRINFFINNQPLSFSSFDLQYNRPDKVIAEIGAADTTLIQAYHAASMKRLKRSGYTRLDSLRVSQPRADFTNRPSIVYEQKNEILEIQFSGRDSLYPLSVFNIWINESPLYGKEGLRLMENRLQFDTSLQILLSPGENRIEASVTNQAGTESYRIPLLLNYTPVIAPKQMTHFIGIGIDQFAERSHNLQYCSKDIRDLAKRFKKLYGDSIRLDTLFNEAVSVENIRALRQKLMQTGINDRVIISYSGHGLLNSSYDYYLSTYKIRFDQPEINGLPYDELENLLDGIPARKKLLLIDACHSGEVDKDEMQLISTAGNQLNRQGIKGGKPTFTGKTVLGMKNSFELMQSLFINVGRSTGATVIAAAAGTQFAREEGKLKNGVFTYSLLEAIDKYPRMQVGQLKNIISQRVVQLTNGLQQPTSRSENQAVDWRVW